MNKIKEDKKDEALAKYTLDLITSEIDEFDNMEEFLNFAKTLNPFEKGSTRYMYIELMSVIRYKYNNARKNGYQGTVDKYILETLNY